MTDDGSLDVWSPINIEGDWIDLLEGLSSGDTSALLGLADAVLNGVLERFGPPGQRMESTEYPKAGGYWIRAIAVDEYAHFSMSDPIRVDIVDAVSE